MPVYEYICPDKNCGAITEAIRDFDRRRRCPKCAKCGGRTKLIISATTFVLTGGGWADSGYTSKNSKK